MSKKTFDVDVIAEVSVTLDESKFNEKFLAEFRAQFYPFHTIEEHAKHIAQLVSREMTGGGSDPDFIEGYGSMKEMGIKVSVLNWYTEIA